MSDSEKLAKIREQNRKRQAKYLQKSTNSAKHAEANKKSYEKRMLKKKEQKEKPTQSTFTEAEMKAELDRYVKMLQEQQKIEVKEPVKEEFIILRKKKVKPLQIDEIKQILIEKVEKKASQDMYINSIKRIMKLFDLDDLIKIISDKNMIKKIIGDRPIKDVNGNIKMIPTPVNTAKADLQAILKIIDTVPIKISDKLKSKIKTAFDVLKEKSIEKSAEAKEDLITFDEYIKKVEEKFGKDSKQYAVVSLYHELPLRDDMQLKIVDSIKSTKDKEQNYLVLNKSPKGRVIVHNYKTSKGLGTIDKELSSKLTNVLKKYMNSKTETDKDYLFTDKKMSSYIQKMNTAIGLKSGINLMRHMAVTEFLTEPKTAEEKVDLAQTMGHSVATQKKYKQTKKESM